MILLITTSIVITIALGEAYVRWIPLSGLPAWAALLMFHAIMSAGLLALLPSLRNMMKLTWKSAVYLIPAIAIVVGSYLMAVILPQAGPHHNDSLGYYIASITLVPVVEEIVFRGGISRVLEQGKTGVWSIYMSGLVFSVAHTIPSLSRIVHLDVGAPLGPFLLGVVCEVLARRSGSLIPAIAFHCACNSTVLIFNLWSPGWLSKLSLLY